MLIRQTGRFPRLFLGRMSRTPGPYPLSVGPLSVGASKKISVLSHTRNKTTPSSNLISVARSVLLVTCTALLGCWSNSKDKSIEPEAVELRSDSAPLSTDVPETELANLSKRLYQSSMYTVARDSLNSLKDRYPLGPYAVLAELKYADSFFYNSEYSDAAIQYEAFSKNHPESPESLYAKLQAARSHARSGKTDGRDRTPWERSLTLYNDLVKTNSELSKTAASERASVIEELKRYDREIIDFYRKTENQAAVEAREAAFQKRWASGTSASPRGTQNLDYGTLDTNLPQTGLLPSWDPSLHQSPLQALTPVPSDSPNPTISDPAIEILGISCSDTPVHYIMIELEKLPKNASALLARSDVLHPQDKRVTLENFSFSAASPTWNCHVQNDAFLETGGRLSLPAEEILMLSAIEHPPRLILTARGE